MRLGRWFVIILAGLAVLAGIGYGALQIPSVQDAAIARVATSLMKTSREDLFKDDALRIAFCGTTGPMPDARRAKICTMVIAGGKFYIVDIGPEATEVISSWRVPMTRLGGLFITHLHSDHIGELGEFNLQSWAQGRDKPLSVYGPPGVERVVNGFAAAYELDRDYRIAHHGAEMMSADNWVMNPVAVPLEGMITPTRERRATMLKDGDLTVTAIEVNHSPIEPAYAYRFDYKGRSVVISGDTSKHFGLAEASKGADVLVHEAQAKHVIEIMIGAAKEANNERLRKIFSDIQNYHTSPVEAAEIANVAGVKLLVLHHFTPPPNNPILGWSFLRGVSAVRSRGVVMADDHMLITVPLSGDAKPKVGRMN